MADRPRRPGATWLGSAKPDDPIYTNADWRFVMGKNVSPQKPPSVTFEEWLENLSPEDRARLIDYTLTQQ